MLDFVLTGFTPLLASVCIATAVFLLFECNFFNEAGQWEAVAF